MKDDSAFFFLMQLFPPLLSCTVGVDIVARYAAYSIMKLLILVWGERSCQRGPSEPTYCAFAEAAVEQNAALGSVSPTSREQDEAPVLRGLVQRTLSLSVIHTNTPGGDEEVTSFQRERERQKGMRWFHLLAWTA